MNMRKLIEWSVREYAALPWRQGCDPYHILVSEIMLQQTTVGTVLNHYERFLKKFPTLKDLANTTEEEILISWKGLGYYRRAKNLRQACIDIEAHHGGTIRPDLESLLSIKGIGDYTARALLAFAFNQEALAVDANIERVLARYYGLITPKGLKLQKEVRARFETGEILAREVKEFGARALNGALMDLGRVYCQARRADCVLCPLREGCQARKNGDPLALPRTEAPKGPGADKHELILLRVYFPQKGKIAAVLKDEGEWLHGQYELPTFILRTSDQALGQYPQAPIKINYTELPSFKTTITKYKITNYIWAPTASELARLKLKNIVFLGSSQQRNLSTASHKALKKVGLV